MSNWNKRYAAEKTAFDAGAIVGPIMHGLGQIGHGLGDAARNVWHQMNHPITFRDTTKPSVMRTLQENVQNQINRLNGNGVEKAQNALENYFDQNQHVDFHPVGDVIDAGLGLSAIPTGIGLRNRMDRKRDESARLQRRKDAWSKLLPYTVNRINEQNGPEANPNHPNHDVNQHYGLWNTPGTDF